MAKWHTIEAKFSDDAFREILKFMKKKRIKNTSQFVKKATEEYLGMSIADAKRKENRNLPLEYRTTYYFYEYLKKSFRDCPEDQKKIEEAFVLWAIGFFSIHTKKHNEKLYKANRLWDIIKIERKVGRPVKEKKSRGRPSRRESGYEK